MAERNGSWIVSLVKWVEDKHGMPEVTFCYSKYYRTEEGARDRFDIIVRSLEEDGFALRSLRVPVQEEYEGMQGYIVDVRHERVYATVYIDRNRTY